MAYATPNSVREALSPEGSEQGNATAAALSDDALADAIAEATSEVDARLAQAPFADGSVPGVVSSITRDVAAYLATLTHRRGNPLPSDHPVALRYLRAEQLLGQGAAGNLELGGEAGGGSSEAQVANPYEGDLFTLESAGIGPGNDLPCPGPWMR